MDECLVGNLLFDILFSKANEVRHKYSTQNKKRYAD